MQGLILEEKPGIDEKDEISKHIVIKVVNDNAPLGNIIIKEESVLMGEEGEQITARLEFDLCAPEEMCCAIIKKVLFYIRNKIESSCLVFEKINIEPVNTCIEIAALTNGFTRNGGKYLILLRENNHGAIKEPEPPNASSKQQRLKKNKSSIIVSRSSQIAILQILLDNKSGIFQQDISDITKLGIATIRAATREFDDMGLIKRIRNSGNAYSIIPEVEKINQKLTEFGVITPAPAIETKVSFATPYTAEMPTRTATDTIKAADKTRTDPPAPDKPIISTQLSNQPVIQNKAQTAPSKPIETMIEILRGYITLGKKGMEEEELQSIASKKLTPREIYYAKKDLKIAGILSAWKGSSFLTINSEKLKEKFKEY